ncbi:MAG: molybdenum cofactor guanylyltransferase MobA [Pseudomonadota bacterium]
MIPAVVLAGGASRRMGGGVKPMLHLGGVPMIERVVSRLQSQTPQIAINANDGDFSQFHYPVIKDSIAGRPGPLAGVLSAMDWAKSEGADLVVTVAGDTPFFPKTLVYDLKMGLDDAPIALAATQKSGRPFAQSVFGIWKTDLADDLRASVVSGTRKVLDFTQPLDAALVVFEDDSDSFFNVNTPEDLIKAEQRLGAS